MTGGWFSRLEDKEVTVTAAPPRPVEIQMVPEDIESVPARSSCLGADKGRGFPSPETATRRLGQKCAFKEPRKDI